MDNSPPLIERFHLLTCIGPSFIIESGYMDASLSQPDALLSWMGSLADAARLRLLRLLERQELGVAELCDVLQMPQSTVSRHLKMLSDQGWVVNRRRGTTNLYRMILDELDPAARKLWLVARDQTDDWVALEQDRVRLDRRLRQRRSEAADFFTGAAAEWNRIRRELYGSGFIGEAVKALLPAQWVVADLGCGTGQFVGELAGYVHKVIGIDNNQAMLDAAKQTTADLSNVDIRVGDLEALPLEDHSCDAALLILVLSYLVNTNQALTEARRVLKPGGKLVIVDLLRHDREDFRRMTGQHHAGFDPEALIRQLHEADLTRPTCRALPPEAEAKGPALLLAAAMKAK